MQETTRESFYGSLAIRVGRDEATNTDRYYCVLYNGPQALVNANLKSQLGRAPERSELILHLMRFPNDWECKHQAKRPIAAPLSTLNHV